MSKKVLMFTGSWCGPCKQAKPKFAQISEEVKDVQFEVVDIDENSALAEEYNIAGVPTFVILQEGKETQRLVGAAFVNKVKEFL